MAKQETVEIAQDIAFNAITSSLHALRTVDDPTMSTPVQVAMCLEVFKEIGYPETLIEAINYIMANTGMNASTIRSCLGRFPWQCQELYFYQEPEPLPEQEESSDSREVIKTVQHDERHRRIYITIQY